MRAAILAGVFALVAAGTNAQTITVTQQSCAQLTRHLPRADVEYRHGEDVVNGKKVVPTDLNATPQIKAPDSFTIPITVEVAHRLGIPAFPDPAHPERDLFKPEANIGTVTYRDGHMYFNDQPMQSASEASLAELCRKARPR